VFTEAIWPSKHQKPNRLFLFAFCVASKKENDKSSKGPRPVSRSHPAKASLGRRSRARATLTASLVAVLLAGCAVKPTPLTLDETSSFGENRIQRIVESQERVTGAISLHEAMARAIKFNLDTQVEQAQTALRLKELDLSHYKMLPSLVASSGYLGRDNTSASSSQSIALPQAVSRWSRQRRQNATCCRAI
jgi:hypothetical protein